MIRVREALVVEGKYDVMRLRETVDALIVPTGGFRIFRDKDKAEFLRHLARTRGLIVLTDSDGAGLVIRRYLQGILPPEQVRQAYIPACPGKEKRKAAPSREGLLGVEGMSAPVLERALRAAGAHIEQEAAAPETEWTVAELYADGLIGRADSARLRALLLQRLGLPPYIAAKHLPQVLRYAVTREEYRTHLAALREILKKGDKSS